MGNKKNIANKYIESKITTRTLLPEEVWERWSAIQREHFLKDHNIKAGQINTIASTEYYKHLPSYVKTEIQEHIKTDHRYAKGGGVDGSTKGITHTYTIGGL